ncbi:MAG: SPOR domain-containing protein [Betaproteobacteria bacterium]
MSFFSFRRDRAAKANAAAADAESVEVVRKRARQRLIGSAVLVLIAVVGFPLLFDSQPRPVPVDIAIEIPSRSTVKPGTPVGPAPAATAAVSPLPEKASAPPAVPASASLQDKEEIVPKAAAPTTPAVVPGPAAAAPPAEGPEGAAEAPRSEGKRAQNLLEGKGSDTGTPGRVVVQVGAYADAGKAREVRQKLEKAGLKTYTQVVDTKDGQRTRVRVGPYPSREEAEKAVARIKALDLPASILTL